MTTLAHRYAPRGTARELFGTRDPEVLVSGPAGTGKSRACLEKLHMMALANPGMKGLICRKTLSSLGSTALETWRQFVVPEAMDADVVRFYGGSPQEAPQYRYTNGSVIVIGGMDRSTRIMSSEYDVIYVQEATELSEDDWEALTTRLRNWRISFQQLIADANPNTPTHWLKVRCDRGKTRMFNSTHEENPRLYTATGELIVPAGAAYMTKLDNLTGVRHARLRKGLWVAAEGLIYEDYNSAVHLIDRFPIPDEWTRYWTVDFGYTNPFTTQMWAEDPDGRLFMYRELYFTRRTVDQHAVRLLDLVSDPNPEDNGPKRIWAERKPRAIICDHDAEGRAQLEKHLGLGTTPAFKKVNEGIQAVSKRLRDNRLFLMRDSLVERDQSLVDAKKPTCLAEELPGYIWDTGTGKAPKEQPLKSDDHGCDALRYIVARIDLAGKTRVRWAA